MLVFIAGGTLIYSGLGGTEAVLEQALAYSDVLFWGVISMWLANSLAAIVRATGTCRSRRNILLPVRLSRSPPRCSCAGLGSISQTGHCRGSLGDRHRPWRRRCSTSLFPDDEMRRATSQVYWHTRQAGTHGCHPQSGCPVFDKLVLLARRHHHYYSLHDPVRCRCAGRIRRRITARIFSSSR